MLVFNMVHAAYVAFENIVAKGGVRVFCLWGPNCGTNISNKN